MTVSEKTRRSDRVVATRRGLAGHEAGTLVESTTKVKLERLIDSCLGMLESVQLDDVVVTIGESYP